MVKLLVIVGFLIVRYLISANKKNAQKKPKANTARPQSSEQNTQPKSIDDIFGDFVKEINKDKNAEYGSKPKPATIKSDSHRAEEDTEKLDWQEVFKSKFDKPKAESKYQNYKTISNSDTIDAPLEIASIEETEVKNEVSVDLKQAVIYQAILERKYFKV